MFDSVSHCLAHRDECIACRLGVEGVGGKPWAQAPSYLAGSSCDRQCTELQHGFRRKGAPQGKQSDVVPALPCRREVVNQGVAVGVEVDAVVRSRALQQRGHISAVAALDEPVGVEQQHLTRPYDKSALRRVWSLAYAE